MKSLSICTYSYHLFFFFLYIHNPETEKKGNAKTFFFFNNFGGEVENSNLHSTIRQKAFDRDDAIDRLHHS